MTRNLIFGFLALLFLNQVHADNNSTTPNNISRTLYDCHVYSFNNQSTDAQIFVQVTYNNLFNSNEQYDEFIELGSRLQETANLNTLGNKIKMSNYIPDSKKEKLTTFETLVGPFPSIWYNASWNEIFGESPAYYGRFTIPYVIQGTPNKAPSLLDFSQITKDPVFYKNPNKFSHVDIEVTSADHDNLSFNFTQFKKDNVSVIFAYKSKCQEMK